VSSGLLALSLLALPVFLALLMILFDSTMQGLLVLLGSLVNVAGWLLGGGTGSLPDYRAIELDPWRLGLDASLRALPCAGGLAIVAVRPGGGWRWWGVAVLWATAMWSGDALVRLVLAPGVAIAAGFGTLAAIGPLLRRC
jgi:hypothetical protein